MRDLFLNVFGISVSASPVIIFLLIFTPLLNKRFAIKWKYLMWIAIAIRLAVPFHISVGTPKIVIDIPMQITEPADMNDTNINIENVASPLPQREHKTFKATMLDIAAYLWLTGCLLFLSVHIFSFLHYKRRIIKKGIIVEEGFILQQICELSGELQINSCFRVMRYGDVGSPMVIGLLDPVLVLPTCDYSREELLFILKHELVHIKRRDIYFKLLFVIANAIHWFNPLVYIMHKEAVVDMELSCDEKVIQKTPYAVRKAYTEILFATFSRHHRKRTTLTTQFYGDKKIMKRRFRNILTETPKKSGVLFCVCTVCIIIILGMSVGCTAMGSESLEKHPQTDSLSDNVSASYAKLAAYKTEDYSRQSIADFNAALAPTPDELTELLAAEADVISTISPDDENYDFFITTMNFSSSELYCEHRGEEFSFNAGISKRGRPSKYLDEDGEIWYEFNCLVEFDVIYTIDSPELLTVAERDNTLLLFKEEMQNYLNSLNEAQITGGDIKTTLIDKADEIAKSLSTEKMKLSCEIYLIEILNNEGIEVIEE